MNSPSPSPSPTPKKTAGPEDAIELLKADHREVEQLFSQFKTAKGRQQRKKLIEKIAAALTAHTLMEEEIFYSACREEGVEGDSLDEAQVEHDTVKLLVADLLRGSQDDGYYDAKVTVLGEYVKHHVGEEEKPNDGIFARAGKADIDMEELGRRLKSRKDELMADQTRLLSRPPKIRSLDLFQQSQEYGDMAGYPSDRYREDESRYGGYRSMGGEYRGGQYGSDQDYGPTRRYGNQDGSYGGRGDERQRPRYRGTEQSASGGRYRDYYDDDYDRPSAGRYLGAGGEDREYYQGTRYGSSYGGGRYRTGNGERDQGRDRYGNGPSYGSRGNYRGDR